MKSGAGRLKGAGFEIDRARDLSCWVLNEPGPRPSCDLFWRTDGSGGKGVADRKNGRHSKQDGDIMAIDPRGDFLTELLFFECKNYKKFDIFMSLHNKNSDVWGWWVKCCQQANDALKEPFLILKANNRPIFIIIRSSFYGTLTSWFNHVSGHMWEADRRAVVFEFKDFLAWTDPTTFAEVICSKGSK
jgi:hypothetical protein